MSSSPASAQKYFTLHSNNSQLVLDCSGDSAKLLYWGQPLGEITSPAMLALLATRQEAPGCAESEAAISLTPTEAMGFLGRSGLQAHRSGQAWSCYAQIESISQASAQQLEIHSRDPHNQIDLIHHLALDPASGVLQASTTITNSGDSPLTLNDCAAPTLMLPPHLQQLLSFEGRWGNEFRLRKIDRFSGAYQRENRCGRSSHDNFPGLIVCANNTRENQGEAYGFHLGWSGNHRIHCEIMADGRSYVQMAELLMPGEIILSPGQSYTSPNLYGAYSSQGLSSLSQCFHRYARAQLSDARCAGKPRPVHYNTWEAIYFNHDATTLASLVKQAADLGVERFVLDDGWFNGRRNDQAGLGDWFVDVEVYPQGLGPLIALVESQGMEFGLWFEPEMVNPDSDLYRAHPDWVLQAAPAPPILARQQLVLNLGLSEVQDYLFQRIDALLRQYNIRYIKWDMNRDLHQAANNQGRAMVHRQTHSLYQLLARLRYAHPQVEIESCASGGGRADYGILAYTDRIWTSDSNDAIDRLRIQKGFSMFFPAQFMGSHVGPYDCHITGRKFKLSTRAGVAMFGHMGLEMNLLELDQADRALLKKAISVHKQHRELIHQGDLFRLDGPDYAHSFGVVKADKSEAIFSYTLLEGHISTLPAALIFAGLNPQALYRISLIWPDQPRSSSRSILDFIDTSIISGAALMQLGMQMPLLKPADLLIFHLRQQ